MKKILIIEDDIFLRDLSFQKLKSLNFEVFQAVDGEEGLKKIIEIKPDLVLLDIILPGMDGFEVLKKKQENKEISEIPVIVLSNLGQKEEIDQGIKLGAKDYLIKAHFTLDEVSAKVKQILG
jgi:DNA-binding response OmpR family regulator